MSSDRKASSNTLCKLSAHCSLFGKQDALMTLPKARWGCARMGMRLQQTGLSVTNIAKKQTAYSIDLHRKCG